jgi:hypothetical protein
MATTLSASTAIMNDLSTVTTNENVVEEAPPSYESLFIEANTSDDIQCQLRSTVPTVNHQCQQPFGNTQLIRSQPIQTIKSHTVWSVLNILFCCCCFGCIASCYSLKTGKLKEQGNTQGALKASKRARSWNVFATGFGVVMFFIQIIGYAIIDSSKIST